MPEERAFLERTMPHLDAVTRVARNLTDNRGEAEDLVQETYLRAFAAFDGHHGTNTRGWLVTICVNLARSRWRARARRPHEDPVADLPERATDELDVADLVYREIQREQVRVALRTLSPEQREAIVLTDIAGHTAAEAAQIIGCPRGTVLARVHRGRRRLAVALEEAGANRDL